MSSTGVKGAAASDATPPAPVSELPRVARPAVEPVRARRRPLLVGLGLALTALGGLGAAWLASTGTGTVTVVGIKREVRAGQIIRRQDLGGVQIPLASGLRSVPVQRSD